MNNSAKFSVSISILLLLIVIIFYNNNIMKASADSIQDASVSTDTAISSETHRAPVSIANYSNEVTESSDTYDYSKKQPATEITDALFDTTHVNVTAAPTDNNNYFNVMPTATPTISPTTIPNNPSQNTKITKKVFIGDSRTVHMSQTIGTKNGDIWSCKSAMGLKWMKSNGVPNIENNITNGTAVIILMGVNDLYNTKNYIEYINQKSSEWAAKGAVTYYVSVNPINESTYKGFKNTEIEKFNNSMQSELKNVHYIDTYNYLITHECNYTSDGLHYTSSTSKKIYELINQNLQ